MEQQLLVGDLGLLLQAHVNGLGNRDIERVAFGARRRFEAEVVDAQASAELCAKRVRVGIRSYGRLPAARAWVADDQHGFVGGGSRWSGPAQEQARRADLYEQRTSPLSE
ncbi:hypothetical protein ACQ87O_00010 [Streptomyces lividans]